MSQADPQVGDVFVDQDKRDGARTLRLLARTNPRDGESRPFWVATVNGGSRTTTIREDRLQARSLYEFQENA